MPVAEKEGKRRKRSARPRRPRKPMQSGTNVQVLYDAQGDEGNAVKNDLRRPLVLNSYDRPYVDDVYAGNDDGGNNDGGGDDAYADDKTYGDDDAYNDTYVDDGDDDAVIGPRIPSFLASKEMLTVVGAIGALAVGWLIYKSLNKPDGDLPGIPGDPDNPFVDPNRKVVIDPWGEGNKAGMDDGGRSYACLSAGIPPLWYTGVTANNFVAGAVGKYLNKIGYPFAYTREGNEEFSVSKRAAAIVKESPAVLVTIRHSNRLRNDCPEGSAIIYPAQPDDVSVRSRRLAELIRSNLQFDVPPIFHNTVRSVSMEGDEDGIEEELYRLLRRAGFSMPASVIIDPSPLCNCKWQSIYKQCYEGNGLLLDDSYISRLGAAIANAIRQYFSANP